MKIFKKRDKFLDLREKYIKEQERKDRLKEDFDKKQEDTEPNSLDFLGAMSGINKENTNKDFSKELLKVTEKIEDLSNQIYHLEQRIEVLEAKLRVNNFS